MAASNKASTRLPELLAPAGQPDAGQAALHYGADAVYLGLNRFSARAEADNFTRRELDAFVAHAHRLSPRRNVYLAINTLLKQSELPDAADALLAAAECGVDAVIAQDLGLARFAREHFPTLKLHASTQMAIHNLEGVLAAGRLGYSRVTLARELTLKELARIAAEGGIETEVFIHGTLCYSYSGLCLCSSMVSGRSGNRGRCAYSCREAAATPDGTAHPFSLKDLALGPRVVDLARAGVTSLKIEGRKKSPLYVAATVDYYRRLLDGKLSPEERGEREEELKTIFARPWTTLFLAGPRNPDAADTGVVGHRGARIGKVESVLQTPAGTGIGFMPSRAVERHDGLQVDVPGDPRPYGFPVDNIYVRKGKRLEAAFVAEAGEEAAVTLPTDAPALAPGLPLYQSSSQAVKRAYPFPRPKNGGYGRRVGVDMAITVAGAENSENAESCRISCRASFKTQDCRSGGAGGNGERISCLAEDDTEAFPARDGGGAELAAHNAFERTGDSRFALAGWEFANPGNLFVKPGVWNRLRRKVLAKLESEWEREHARSLAVLCSGLVPGTAAGGGRGTADAFSWSVFADRAEYLEGFAPDDFSRCEEIILAVDWLDLETADAVLCDLAEKTGGRDKIRLATPLIERHGTAGETGRTVDRLRDLGWERWMAPGLAGWGHFDRRPGADVTADWPLYTLNGLAAGQLLDMGFSGFTLSPEDDAANLAELLAAYPERACLVAYSDVPLFISAACAHAHLRLCGRKTGDGSCGEDGKPLRLAMEKSGGVSVWTASCGSVVTARLPYAPAAMAEELRAIGARRLRVDLRWRRYRPDEAAEIWKKALKGDFSNFTLGNWRRGLM